eukprot:5815764-Ditylum_brightwellii.AAC.1
MVLPEVRSRTGGHFQLSTKPNETNTNEIPLNGAIHSECITLCNVMGSTVKVKVGGLYINCQHREEFRMALQEMGHLQLPTIVITDSSTAEGIVNNLVKQHKMHAIDM